MKKLIMVGLLGLNILAACSTKSSSVESADAPKPANPSGSSRSVDSQPVTGIQDVLLKLGVAPVRDDNGFRESIDAGRVKVERSSDGQTTTLSVFLNNEWKKSDALDKVTADYAWTFLHEQPGCSAGTPEAALTCDRPDDGVANTCNATFTCSL